MLQGEVTYQSLMGVKELNLVVREEQLGEEMKCPFLPLFLQSLLR